MSNAKISSLTELTTVASNDIILVTDVSDLTSGSNGTSKKIQKSNLVTALAPSDITGVTSSVAELNVLDGIPATLTATELGYVDGVTSAIQTQINTKAPTADPVFTGNATFDTNTLFVDGTNNKILMGGTTYDPNFAFKLEVDDENGSNSNIGIKVAGGGGGLELLKSNGTLTNPTIVLNGDPIGGINFHGYDGSNFQLAASITSFIDGTPGVGDMPANLLFSVTKDGESVPTLALKIKPTLDLSMVTGANIQVNEADPTRAFYVPASAMWPSTTAGCAALTKVESSTNKVNVQVLDFDGAGTSKEFAEFGIQSPTYWDTGTVTVQFVWLASAGSGTVKWEIAGGSFADSDPIDAAYGTLQTVTDTVLSVGDVHISAETPALTIAGTPTAGDWLQFRVDRDPANDTNTSDARLLGCRIRFVIGQYNDA